MRPTNSDINKWFTRVRRHLDGPPGFKRADAKNYVCDLTDFHKGLMLVPLDKAHTRESLCFSFGCFVGFPFDMSSHWIRSDFYSKYNGMRIEKFVSLEGYFSSHDKTRFLINSSNSKELEERCAQLYLEVLKPWLDKFQSREDVLEKVIEKSSFAVPYPFGLILNKLNSSVKRSAITF